MTSSVVVVVLSVLSFAPSSPEPAPAPVAATPAAAEPVAPSPIAPLPKAPLLPPPPAPTSPPAARVPEAPAAAPAVQARRADRVLLVPIDADDAPVPPDLVARLVASTRGLALETSACATPQACAIDRDARGAASILRIRIRRVGDLVIARLAIEDETGALIAEATDGGRSEEMTAVVHRAFEHIAARRKVALGPPIDDLDRDGVKTPADRCPNDAGPELTFGCPDPDQDGVVAADDKCPTVKGHVATSGCTDVDGDGVHDGIDRCPTTRARTADGCPAIVAEKSEERGRDATAAPPPDTRPPAGPDWGRVISGGIVSFLTTAVGIAAAVPLGWGLAWLVLGETTDYPLAVASGAVAAGLFSGLLPQLPDAACSLLCDYPLATGILSRVLVFLVAGGAAAGTYAGLQIMYTEADRTLTMPMLVLGVAPAAALLIVPLTVSISNLSRDRNAQPVVE